MRSALTWSIKILVSVGLLYWLLSKIDRAALWHQFQTASPLWIVVALALYLAMLSVSAWRWHRLLEALRVQSTFRHLLASYLVATFFNNFLPSNIGGDVIRIRDTAAASGSRTQAATTVLLDRVIGLLGLVFVAALGASIATELGDSEPFNPIWLWLGTLGGAAVILAVLYHPRLISMTLRPLTVLHKDWVTRQIERLVDMFERFAQTPSALGKGFAGAVVVQMILVGFYAALARAMQIPMPAVHLAVLIPMSFIVQLLPLSVNGFGVRESIFVFYFSQLHLPKESAIALSFLGAALIMLFSVSGAVVMFVRKRH